LGKGWCRAASGGGSIGQLMRVIAAESASSLVMMSNGCIIGQCLYGEVSSLHCCIFAISALMLASINSYGSGAATSNLIGCHFGVIVVLHAVLTSSRGLSRRLKAVSGKSWRESLVGISHRIIRLRELVGFVLHASNFETFNCCSVGEGPEMVAWGG